MARRSRAIKKQKFTMFMKRLPEIAKNEIRKEIEGGAARIFDDALANMPKPGSSPYATGDLVRKFRIQFSVEGMRARIGTFGPIRFRSPHAGLVEFGTAAGTRLDKAGKPYRHPGTKAHPFLFPAAKKHRSTNFLAIREAFRRALRLAVVSNAQDLEG